MPMAATRGELIACAQRGDAAALERLLRECRGDVRRYAQRHCLMSEVDDAVQETLFAVTRHLRSLRAAASFAAWLFTVVRRECRRLTRKVLRHENVADERIEAWLVERTDYELRFELAVALESLPAHYRDIILLRDFEELTMTEIAERLGLSLPNAKSRLRRARILVREYLLAEHERDRV